jgi:hypothetical protein
MNNNERLDWTSFARYLLGNNMVRPGVERFLVAWIRRFFASRHHWQQLPWFEQLPLYLNMLAENGMQKWQIAQAEQADRIYFTGYQTSLAEESASQSSNTEF